jgi:hypothetical protein
MVGHYSTWFGEAVRIWSGKLSEVETRTKILREEWDQIPSKIVDSDWKNVDLVDIMRTLNTITTGLAVITVRIHQLHVALNFLLQDTQSFRSKIETDGDCYAVYAREAVVAEQRRLVNSLDAIDGGCQIWSARTQAQIQSVRIDSS